MKLASYNHRHIVSCGIITDDGIIDIPSNTQGTEKLHSVKEILIKGDKAFDILRKLEETISERLDVNDVSLCAPIPRPGKLLALAGNYKKHLEESAWQDTTFEDQATSTNPWPFLMPSTGVTGTQSHVPWPGYSDEVDYEAELAVFIGANAHRISPEQAAGRIAGYSIANDISARSVTFTEGRRERPRDKYFDWLMGKWSDGFLPLGPWLVTADQIQDPQQLEIETKVNGVVRQSSSTSQMIFDVYKIVSFMSQLMTLEPGDVIITGTPHGVAMADGKYLQPGDVVECSIEQIGTLRNTMGAKPREFYKGFIQ